MTATIIDTHHCVEINNTQLDLFYNFISNTIEVYIDGQHYISAKFHPGRVILSYTNVLQVATTYYVNYTKAQTIKQQLLQKELNQDIHINQQ